MFNRFRALATVITVMGAIPVTIHAQDRDRDRQDWATRIEPGTRVVVRTNQFIESDRMDNRIYTGTVDQDVRGTNGQLAIPRGSQVEMVVRTAPDNDLVLDLDSVTVRGRRYAIKADERIESQKGQGLGENRSTAEHVGGGALIGSIIGAIAGGGQGAAIGAAAGAGAGASVQVMTRGRRIRVPAESLLTFRFERPLEMGVPDQGYDRDGAHYHGDDPDRRRDNPDRRDQDR